MNLTERLFIGGPLDGSRRTVNDTTAAYFVSTHLAEYRLMPFGGQAVFVLVGLSWGQVAERLLQHYRPQEER